MTREDEIKKLQSLKEGTYFCELFGAGQIDAMCENIRRDHPIECGIDLFRDSQVAKENAMLKGRLATRWEAEERAAKDVLKKAIEHMDVDLEDVAERLIGRKKCLAIKLKDDLPLTEDDRDDLLKYVENN